MSPAPLRRLLPLVTLFFALTFATADFAAEPARCAAEKPVPVERIQEVEDAIKRFQADDFKAAFELLKEARKKHPELQPPHPLLRWFLRPDAWAMPSGTNRGEGQPTEADHLLSQAGTLRPHAEDKPNRYDALQLQILAGQAAVAEYRENWSGAQRILEEWHSLEPKNAGVLQRLGRVLFLQNTTSMRNAAYARFKEAKAIDPSVLMPEAQMAQLYEAARQHAEAQKWMERALKAAPKDDVETRLVAAQWAVGTDELDKAKQWSDDALAIDPKNGNVLLMCGIVAMYRGDSEAAERFFETAGHRVPAPDFAATNNLAIALIEQDDDQKARRALKLAESNLRANPRRPEAHATLGRVLFKLRRLDEAEDALRKAIELGGDDRSGAPSYLKRVMEEKRSREDGKKKSDLERLLEPK
jgi:tetratricopeptide (TPR) repeat protein